MYPGWEAWAAQGIPLVHAPDGLGVVSPCVGWSVLLHMEAKDEELFLVPPNLKSLPTYIPVKGGGFVTLYYDNLFVVGVDQKIMERVRNRI